MGFVKKLMIKSGYRATVVNPPEHFTLPAEELPEDVEVTGTLEGSFDFVLLFVHSKAELDDYAPKVLPHLRDDAHFWVAYPKKSSKIKTDISRDSGWEVLKEAGYVGVSLISIDDTWSAFRVRKEAYVKSTRK
ncbi:hypothetical protein ACI7RC_18770 [Brevibacillus sp. B_LB10_24]|uniref:hypothetical protein n=1 Tax=Brevibacillus sp. B_LB10_24 TaxID=3380645 RepID=UPI0038BD4063